MFHCSLAACRNLDNKLSTDSDTEQYKLLNVKEDPIDNRQQYLDVMCFPTLFPTGKFGKHHPRAVKLSHSEHIKSRLLNKDSRFRKGKGRFRRVTYYSKRNS